MGLVYFGITLQTPVLEMLKPVALILVHITLPVPAICTLMGLIKSKDESE
jgi:hypothetical protein